MSQFLVIGQPLENLFQISKGQYRTEAQTRYEALNKNNNTFKTRFLNVAMISAFAVLLFANTSYPTFKTMAGLFVIFVTVGLIFYPAKRNYPNKEEEAATIKIFEDVTTLVNNCAEAKIKAVQELLLYGRFQERDPFHFQGIVNQVTSLYDAPRGEPFAIPSYIILEPNSALNTKLTPDAEAMREQTVQVRIYAHTIFHGFKHVPSHLDSEWIVLMRACERLIRITDCNLTCEKDFITDNSREIRIKRLF